MTTPGATTRSRVDGTMFDVLDDTEAWKGMRITPSRTLDREPTRTVKNYVRQRITAGEDPHDVFSDTFSTAQKVTTMKSNSPSAESTMTVKEAAHIAIKKIALRIEKEHAERGEPISPQKSLVYAYQSPEGLELMKSYRHPLSHLTLDQFKQATTAKQAALPVVGKVLATVEKRAGEILKRGEAPTIEKARAAVYDADPELAELERDARTVLRS